MTRAAGVRVRKRRPKVETTEEGWAAAFEECARDVEDGGYAVLHRGQCPASRGGVCDCYQPVIVGPAVRGVLQ